MPFQTGFYLSIILIKIGILKLTFAGKAGGGIFEAPPLSATTTEGFKTASLAGVIDGDGDVTADGNVDRQGGVLVSAEAETFEL